MTRTPKSVQELSVVVSIPRLLLSTGRWDQYVVSRPRMRSRTRSFVVRSLQSSLPESHGATAPPARSGNLPALSVARLISVARFHGGRAGMFGVARQPGWVRSRKHESAETCEKCPRDAFHLIISRSAARGLYMWRNWMRKKKKGGGTSQGPRKKTTAPRAYPDLILMLSICIIHFLPQSRRAGPWHSNRVAGLGWAYLGWAHERMTWVRDRSEGEKTTRLTHQ